MEEVEKSIKYFIILSSQRCGVQRIFVLLSLSLSSLTHTFRFSLGARVRSVSTRDRLTTFKIIFIYSFPEGNRMTSNNERKNAYDSVDISGAVRKIIFLFARV